MEVKTDKWVLPNRIGYNENIFKTFRPEFYFSSSKNKLTCNRSEGEIDDKKINLFPQQRLIRDYMNIDSPYRGALLYHELGAGKSGASIAAAEGYINKKKMFVLSPASLAVNYENEIIKISSIGLNLKKDWTLLKVTKSNKEVEKVLNEKYSVKTSIIKRDGLVWIPLYEDDIPNAIIIKKSVDSTDKTAIDVMISHIIRNRYTFISYNGLTQKLLTSLGKTAFDNSFIIIDEVHNFASRIVNGSKLARDIYTKMMNAKECKILLLSGTPIINNPYEIATIINLVRGYMTVYELNYSKTSKTITEKDFKSNVKLLSIIDEFYIDNDKRKIFISLLPYGYTQTETELQKEGWDISEEKAIDLIMDNINSIQGIKLNSKYTTQYYSSLPNSKEDFDSFFIDTTKEDTPKIKNADLFMRRILGTVSYYSISGSELFPRRLPDITHNLPMTNNQFKRYLDVRAIERKMEAAKGGVMDDKTSVYRAFSRMVCNFSFPEEIERLYPNDVKKAMKKELDEDETASQPSTASSTSKGKAKAVNVYEEKLKEAISKLKKSEMLTYENVKKHLSPKFAQMYDDIETSPGSVLVYSQFRLVEGLGLLTEFLSKNGFKELDLKKQDGKFYLSDKEVLEPIYNNKRYVIFNQDKEKTRILMNLFNGDFANLPKEIQEQLPSKSNQLYGELVKVFCITASGAEGISLKNVRRVLITEPYWNNIRIEQVIGRAIRSCSHESLPLKDRDVCVYRYLMTFTKKQLEKDYSIETLDKRLSTDEHISQMAEKKNAIVNQFLQMLKISSFDCIINAEQNKPLKNNYKCFSWALGVNKKDLAYTMDIKDDYKIMKHKKFQVEKKGKGRVIIKKGIKYVLLDGKIYNYHSYKNAGILIPEVI